MNAKKADCHSSEPIYKRKEWKACSVTGTNINTWTNIFLEILSVRLLLFNDVFAWCFHKQINALKFNDYSTIILLQFILAIEDFKKNPCRRINYFNLTAWFYNQFKDVTYKLAPNATILLASFWFWSRKFYKKRLWNA